MSGEARQPIPDYAIPLSGDQLINSAMDEMYRAPTIAAERTLQLDMIRRFQPNVPEYQGEEPWPMGSIPNETALQALARQRREYRVTINDDRTMGPAEIVDMHERQAYRFDDDDDGSRSDDDHPSTTDDEALMRDMGAALNLELAEWPEDQSLDAFARIRVIFEEVYCTLEELDDGDYQRVLEHFLNTVGARYCRAVRRAWFDFSAATQADRRAGDEARREARREAVQDKLRAEIWALEGEVDIWSHHLRAANTLFSQAYRRWEREDPRSAKYFTQHIKNAGLVTKNGARLTSIMMWFDEVPEDVKATRSRLARCFNKLAVLRHDIKIIEFEIVESEGVQELPTQEMKDYEVSEDFNIAVLLKGLKTGRYGFETQDIHGPDTGPHTTLFATFQDEPTPTIERIQASLQIRWRRLQLAEKALSKRETVHLRAIAAIWHWTEQALQYLEKQPELIGALAFTKGRYTPVEAAWVNATAEAKAMVECASALERDYAAWRRNGCVGKFVARRYHKVEVLQVDPDEILQS